MVDNLLEHGPARDGPALGSCGKEEKARPGEPGSLPVLRAKSSRQASTAQFRITFVRSKARGLEPGVIPPLLYCADSSVS